MKLLLFILAVYVGYRILRSWLDPNAPKKTRYSGSEHRQIDDVMVKDPVCEVYFPKKEGLRVRVDGEAHYFCSTGCRDKFLENRKSG